MYLNGYEFRRGTHVITKWTEEGPIFAQIKYICAKDSKVYLIIEYLRVVHYERHLHAYHIKPHEEVLEGVIIPAELFDYRPVTAVQPHGNLSAKYVVVQFSYV